jgi:hypothetical protein
VRPTSPAISNEVPPQVSREERGRARAKPCDSVIGRPLMRAGMNVFAAAHSSAVLVVLGATIFHR